MMSTKRLKIGLPTGSLQDATLRVFGRAGFRISLSERSYFPSVDDPELEPMLFRAQEMSHYVEAGVLDCGITGSDWIAERGSKVQTICELRYAKRSPVPVRWVVAVPADGPVRTVKHLAGKRIATELVGVTERFLKQRRVKAAVEFSWGATEAKVTSGLVDAIVEVTETEVVLKTVAEETVTMGGNVDKRPKREMEVRYPINQEKQPLPPGAKVVETAEEEVDVLGKKYRCKREKIEMAQGESKSISISWTCPDIPDEVVKTETTMEGQMKGSGASKITALDIKT